MSSKEITGEWRNLSTQKASERVFINSINLELGCHNNDEAFDQPRGAIEKLCQNLSNKC